MNKDLTVGKPETVLWKFCLPLFGSIVFQQLYNIADSLIAGKFVGEKALAAVGNSFFPHGRTAGNVTGQTRSGQNWMG